MRAGYRPILRLGLVLLFVLAWLAPRLAHAQPTILPLSAYPRPPADNGRGIHWAPVLMTQPQATVDRYLAEVDALGLRWLKLMQPDQPQLEHRYLLAQLQARGIEPVLRVYRTYNDPYEHLDALVRAGVQAGVEYYELYSNPNVAGLAGGWRGGQGIDIARLARQWAQAARTVRAAGGYPGLPALAPNGAIDDVDFLRRFLGEVKGLGALDALDRAWLPVQNYMSNLPLDDPEGFRKFETYHRILREETGLTLPIITTEGGAIVGDREDPRYPPMTDESVAQRTVAAFAYMETKAPDYYFAFMPWLLVNEAAGGSSNAWEAHAWFPVEGQPRPVVEAVKHMASGKAPTRPAPKPTPTGPDAQYAQQPASESDATFGATSRGPAFPLDGSPAPDDARSGAPQAESAVVEKSRIVATGAVSVREESITLPTYDYARAFVETTADDPIYPAPRLDPERVGAPTPRSYRAIVLENDFTRLTILPELGGRIYRWEDKETGWDILYHNPVVKPTPWGVRGWWLAAGGMEWTFPLPNHGLNEYKPWQAETIAEPRSAGVRLTRNGPDGLRVTVMVALNADQRFFAVTTELDNQSGQPLTTHYWANAMLAPGPENRVAPGSQLVWPADGARVHGRGNGGPNPGTTFDWPSGSGPDLSRLDNWPQSLSFFARPQAQRGAAGLVVPEGDVAIVRSFSPRIVPGVKAFYAPGLDPALWTDDGSGPYFELWGGPATDFDSTIRLDPGQSRRWTEQWYTAPGLGVFVAANSHAALALHPQGESTELRLVSTGSDAVAEARLVVRVDDAIVHNAGVALDVGELYRLTIPERLAGRHWIVQLFDRQNRVLLAYDNRLEPAPNPAPRAEKPPIWDSRLDDLGIQIIPAAVQPGQSYWKVVKAEFENPQEGGGRHHIYIEVQDEAGKRILGQAVEVFWPDGSATVVTEDKPAPEYAANFPMYGDLGGYSVRIPDGPSDTVTGMGLPWGRMHVVYNVVFQRAVKQ